MLKRFHAIFKAAALLLLLWPLGSMAVTSAAVKVAFYDQPHDPVLTAISLRVWSGVATLLPLKYTTVAAKSKQQALEWLKQGKVRVVIGPLKVNDNTLGLDFINSYIPDAVGIVTPDRLQVSFFTTVKGYFEALFGVTVGSIIILIMVFGTVIWWLERNKNSSMYAQSPVRGIADSIWQCLVTFSTVGYGDIVPKTFMGRIVTGVWIIISLFLVSAFVATITSELTYMKSKYDKLTSLGQLYGQRVGVVTGDKQSLAVAKEYHTNPIAYASLADVIAAVSNQQIVAAMDNQFAMKNYLNLNPNPNVVITPFEIVKGHYAFALRKDDPLQPRLTRLLYTLSEIGHIKEAIESVIGPVHTVKKS